MTNKNQTFEHISAVDRFLSYLKEGGYRDIKLIDENRYACLVPFAFTHAIIIGKLFDMCSYDDRWCYETYGEAMQALKEWDGQGEPQGWHRHPFTGRRRQKGDPATEYVNL